MGDDYGDIGDDVDYDDGNGNDTVCDNDGDDCGFDKSDLQCTDLSLA